MEKIYYPYPAKDGINKYYIITKSGKKIYFGDVGYFDFTLRKDVAKYIQQHEKREIWINGIIAFTNKKNKLMIILSLIFRNNNEI